MKSKANPSSPFLLVPWWTHTLASSLEAFWICAYAPPRRKMHSVSAGSRGKVHNLPFMSRNRHGRGMPTSHLLTETKGSHYVCMSLQVQDLAFSWLFCALLALARTNHLLRRSQRCPDLHIFNSCLGNWVGFAPCSRDLNSSMLCPLRAGAGKSMLWTCLQIAGSTWKAGLVATASLHPVET